MFDRTPHRRWCSCCGAWLYCPCWRSEDHYTALLLTPKKIPRSLESQTRARRRARAYERAARNAWAWRRAHLRRLADAEARADEHAHMRELHGPVDLLEMPSTWPPEAF